MAFKKIFIAVFLVFLFANAFSQEIFVALNPVNHASPVKLYESEIVVYELVVINNEELKLTNFKAQISVGPQLALVVNGKEKKERIETILSMEPMSTIKKEVKVKGLSFSSTPLKVNVNYGFGENLVNSYSTTLVVTKSPLNVNARLEKTALEPLEENNVLLDLTNTSQKKIKNLSAKLTVPQEFVNKSSPLEFSFFVKEQSVLNSAFLFVAPNEQVGEKIVTLTINYEDSVGPHAIKKNLVVDVRNRGQFLFLISGIIVILILATLFLTFKRKEPVNEETNSKEPVQEKVPADKP